MYWQGLFVSELVNSGDPLIDQKRTTVKKVENEAEVRKAMQNVLSLIEQGNMAALARLMNLNSEEFESRYTEGLFAEKDFCPAEIVSVTEVTKGKTVSLRIEVMSRKRQQNYAFTLLSQQKGKYRILSILPIMKNN